MPEPLTDWLTNPTAQMVVEINDGKAHAWVSVMASDGSKRQRTQIDASKGNVILVFVRDPDPAKASERATAIAATHRFVLAPTDRIAVEPIPPILPSQRLLDAIEEVMASTESRALARKRLQEINP